MAEYYPLLAKAVGSLPNSTSDTRRIVYERARKALIGQLRTYHPPVPDEDIERESLELDRAIERIETELAAAPPAAPATPPVDASPKPADGSSKPADTAPKSDDTPPKPKSLKPKVPAATPSGALGPAAPRKPVPPLRPRVPKPAVPGEPKPPVIDTPPTSEAEAPVSEANLPAVEPKAPASDTKASAGEPNGPVPQSSTVGLKLPAAKPEVTAPPPPAQGPGVVDSAPPRPRIEGQRPFAPQPPVAQGPKRRFWIIPAGIAVVVALVAILAWKIRVKPETIAHNTPAATQPAQDTGKIADRVGGAKPSEGQPTETPPTAPQDQPQQATSGDQQTPQEQPAQPDQPAQQDQAAQQPSPDASKATPPPTNNPEVPVAYRAALLVEAPDVPSKVQTFAGTVVWKLNNTNSSSPGDAVGLAVEADIDLPDDKTKIAVIFEKNSDSSLPASHTIKVRFTVGPGSYSGDVKQINVPQMRREGNTDGEPLAGVTVPVVQNSFLVGLSPGNAETANLRLLSEMPWVDIPILLNSGKIAKLTFEKGAAGQRDFAEAETFWQKQ